MFHVNTAISDYISWFEKIESLRKVISQTKSQNLRQILQLQITYYEQMMDNIEKNLELIEF